MSVKKKARPASVGCAIPLQPLADRRGQVRRIAHLHPLDVDPRDQRAAFGRAVAGCVSQ
jgi:hypothetical protein